MCVQKPYIVISLVPVLILTSWIHHILGHFHFKRGEAVHLLSIGCVCMSCTLKYEGWGGHVACNHREINISVIGCLRVPSSCQLSSPVAVPSQRPLKTEQTLVRGLVAMTRGPGRLWIWYRDEFITLIVPFIIVNWDLNNSRNMPKVHYYQHLHGRSTHKTRTARVVNKYNGCNLVKVLSQD